MARKKTGKAPSLHGRQLMKSRVKLKRTGRAPREEFASRHVAEEMMKDDQNGRGLSSVVERTDLQEFLMQALLSERDFEATKSNVLILDDNDKAVALEDLPQEVADRDAAGADKVKVPTHLPIPRRPAWDSTTTKAELDVRERQAFLEWRRGLAEIEENTRRVMSPFEKNIEVWKQLWRVVERSQVVVQIVDARDPTLYRCVDLERYVREGHRANLLLINKADCLSPHMRREWAKYFRSQGVRFCFFSALAEAERAELAPNISRGHHALGAGEQPEPEAGSLGAPLEEGSEPEDSASDGEEDEEAKEAPQQAGAAPEAREAVPAPAEEERGQGEESKEAAPEPKALTPEEEAAAEAAAAAAAREEFEERVLDKDELLGLLEEMCLLCGVERDAKGRYTVGMVGYPNVGKSSTINVLYGEKKVSVAPTPGKTKNFQTLMLGESIILCDCPGLVFPTMVSSRSELVVSGVLPPDQMREYVKPVDVITRRVPRAQFHSLYRLTFPPGQPVTGQMLLDAHASMRGFFKDHGRPDANRSARLIIKDYVNAKLLFCHHPPTLDDGGRKAWFHDFLDWTCKAVGSEEEAAAKAAEVAAVRKAALATSRAAERAAARDLKAPHRPRQVEVVDTSNMTKKQRRQMLRQQKDRKGRRKVHEDDLATVEAHTSGKRGQRNFRRANLKAGQR